jgi:hypothetical protein
MIYARNDVIFVFECLIYILGKCKSELVTTNYWIHEIKVWTFTDWNGTEEKTCISKRWCRNELELLDNAVVSEDI